MVFLGYVYPEVVEDLEQLTPTFSMQWCLREPVRWEPRWDNITGEQIEDDGPFFGGWFTDEYRVDDLLEYRRVA